MADPKIADTKPVILDLEPGTYYWCKCGESATQPFCDGSHKETEFSPVCFTIEETKKAALCNCKMTYKEPHCDGTHKSLKKEE